MFDFDVPPIPRDNELFWTEKDAEELKASFYGYTDDPENLPFFREEYRPKIPKILVKNEEGRYFIAEIPKERWRKEMLEVDATIPAQLLHVNANDILFCRYYEDENYFKSTKV